MGNCGPESFDLVGGFDYRTTSDGVEILVTVKGDAEVVGGNGAGRRLAANQLNKVFVKGSFARVSFDSASSSDALVVVLTTADGAEERMTVNAVAVNG